MNTAQLTTKIKEYLLLEMELMSDNAPLIKLMKPIISRVLNKNLSKITSALDLLADNDGNIDAEAIVSEMIDSVITSKPFSVNVPMLGDINIGDGKVKFNLPFTDNQLMLDSNDLNTFKDMLKE